MQITLHKRIAQVLHLVIIPAVLIVSDLFIGFMGHFSGTTGNAYTSEAFIDYVTHLQLTELIPVLAIAIIVVAIVEIVTRTRVKAACQR